MTVAQSGAYYIDALIDEFSWTGTTGSGTTVTYSYSSPPTGSTAFNSTFRTAAENAMQAIENVCGITFAQASSADIAFGVKDLGVGTAGLASYAYTGSTLTNADVFMDDEISDVSVGSDGFLTMIHEIGHALGLKHPGAYSDGDLPPYLSSAEDTNDATVMSYNYGTYTSFNSAPTTPMIYDIAALQYLYGANTSYNNGNTTYSYTGSAIAKTIWDGGGTDTISAADYSGGATIDLREGVSYVTTVGQSYSWNAFGANIENALGGSGNDILWGNGLNNYLIGGAGADSAYGLDGNDTIGLGGGNDLSNGNGGNDQLSGGAGADSLWGGRDADSIYGERDDDVVNGNLGVDVIYGGDGNDLLNGGQESDSIFGEAGNDTVSGDRGNDYLEGGDGNDVFSFRDGFGNDTIGTFDQPGAGAGDIIRIFSGTGGVTTTAQALAAVSYSGSDATLTLGTDTVLILGVGNNALTEVDFLIA